ncbi:putative deoxyhypusine hydroxylase [Phaeomoniella chlamydospora]|uniref:Deoxyhypusine hydroxylase n=1 Tax=Phaeomoniella chlamydospora TaxID=158046 RepID=A0A0G2E0K5_PHACM|nr:putative deoxyhypusine hydroxylase [Phaeomoniella chlamydospora]
MSPAAVSDAVESGAESIDTTVAALRKVLVSENVALASRFRALFSLKHLASQHPPTSRTFPAIDAIAAAFTSPSALLKHELAYCLGQTKHDAAIPYLRSVLEDREEDAMCRHEAAEALGALGDVGSVELLAFMRDDESEPTVVRETCDIALDRIQWENSKERRAEKLKARYETHCLPEIAKGTMKLTLFSDFASIDPAPPMPLESAPQSIESLRSTLLDASLPLFKRYRAMFALRDLASPPDLPTAIPAVQALSAGFTDSSALFRHEIAFVFGQLSHPASIPSLVTVLSNLQEASMVRHEAAEALGSLGGEAGVEDTLKTFINDPEQVVRESVIVALDMAEYERKGEMEYAMIPEVTAA